MERSSRDKHTRLSRAALETLTAWFEAHQAHPYPTINDKAALRAATGLYPQQINDWFANARRRRPRPAFFVTQQDGHCASYVQQDVVPGLQLSRQVATKIYQCTFCRDSFATKHDWTRHEVAVHLPLKRYICCPFGPITITASGEEQICSYCGQKDATGEHTGLHRHYACQDRPPQARIFTRKDHLKQHLKAVHECELLPHMEEQWMLEAVYVNSRCGFCAKRFSTWDERNEHIASHYTQGLSMKQWTGCRGLDSDVAALVTLAMPPFLIGQQDAQPFGTSLMTYGPRRLIRAEEATIWDGLVDELQKFIRRSSSQRLTLADQTLRNHARLSVYGASDARGKTPADNPEWLDLFKRSYSLGLLPNLTERSYNNVAEDLEVYQDLGIQLPSKLQSTQRSSALVTLFRSDGPTAKCYHRFSSVEIPLHLALAFETIAKPWPDSGVLGDMVNVREMVFLKTLNNSLVFQLEFQPSFIGNGEHIREVHGEQSHDCCCA